MGYKIGFWLLLIFFVCYKFNKQAEVNRIYIEQIKQIELYKIKFKTVKQSNDSLCKYWDEKDWSIDKIN
jgi:hypothetical protein